MIAVDFMISYSYYYIVFAEWPEFKATLLQQEWKTDESKDHLI